MMMDRIAFTLIAVLLIFMALLFVTPQEQQSAELLTVKIQRHTIELQQVENVRITREGTLRFTSSYGNHLQKKHYFINLKAGNVTLVEDDEFAPGRIQLTDTIHGGLQITLASSLGLDFDYLETPREDLVHNLSELFSEVSAHSP